MFTKLMTLVSGLALCAAATGCSVSVDEHHPPPTSTASGTLTTLWTLDGSDSADACTYYDIDRVEVFVFDEGDFSVADAAPYCEDFGVSFDLPVGWYSTEMTLLDFGGHAVSDTVVTDITVERDTETTVDVNFPDASIF